jgi:two-component system, cell cycle response regulator
MLGIDRHRGSLLLWASLALGVAGLAAHTLYLAAGSPDAFDNAVNVWAYNGVLFACALTCFLRAARSARLRAAWAAFGIGLTLWALGDTYWTIAFTDMRRVPYPSPADAGYLAAIPFFFIGIALLTRHRMGRFTAQKWLDGAIAALAAAAVGVALLAPALIGLTKGDTAAVLTNLAYPLGDLILIAFVASAVVVSGLRGAGALLLIGAGLVVWAGADSVYLYQEATSAYQEGWLDSLWLVGALLIGFAACFSVRHAPVRRADYRSPLWLPAAAAVAAVGILVWDHFDRNHEASVWLAGATLVAVAIRLALSFRENERLLEALHSEAISDALTGLGNRRRLMNDLAYVLAREEPHHLALFDLDGFKSYNDSFGHPAGDALLCQLGGRLAVSVGAGEAYRLGGDEFCILVPVGDWEAEHVVEAARSALSAHGEGFKVGASSGHATIPAEAATPSEALRIVDQRMYAEKSGRSTRVAHQTHELLLRILREREPALGEHVEGVARMATEMARVLGVDSEGLDVVRRAAELHDIGKIAIPDEILAKPGPLDEREWDLMRRHTLIGERILGAAPALRPVAELVRASHERWDGQGYPDGRAAGKIPLGARIIFVCDAFEAMTASRPYRPPLTEKEAIDELRRHAGTQFDPALVDLFVRLWAAARNDGPATNGAAPALVSDPGFRARS